MNPRYRKGIFITVKRIVTIQDISCIGKCSLTVALPIISAMSVETAVLPTAVLSTHTMFSGFTFADLTDQIRPIAEHWKKEQFTFDAIYTGYLGSFEQIRLSCAFMEDFKEKDTMIFVDPVMADNGKLYAGFDMDFAREMKKLCSRADVIMPNLTEAAFLTDTPYREDPDEAYLSELLEKLSSLGPRYVVLTGFSPASDRIGAIAMEAASGRIFRYDTQKQPKSYHGTGDIFASTLVGGMMNGFSLEEAVKTACGFTAECIRLTIANPDSRIYGVDFEAALPMLLKHTI